MDRARANNPGCAYDKEKTANHPDYVRPERTGVSTVLPPSPCLLLMLTALAQMVIHPQSTPPPPRAEAVATLGWWNAHDQMPGDFLSLSAPHGQRFSRSSTPSCLFDMCANEFPLTLYDIAAGITPNKCTSWFNSRCYTRHLCFCIGVHTA